MRFRGLASPFGVASHCPHHCGARVAQGIRGIQTYRCPRLPPAFAGSPHKVPDPPNGVDGNCERGSCSLPDLTGHLTARADDGHAPPLGVSGKVFSLTFILPSPLVRFPALNPIKPHTPPLVYSPANSFKFQPCDRTPQAAGLTPSLRPRITQRLCET